MAPRSTTTTAPMAAAKEPKDKEIADLKKRVADLEHDKRSALSTAQVNASCRKKTDALHATKTTDLTEEISRLKAEASSYSTQADNAFAEIHQMMGERDAKDKEIEDLKAENKTLAIKVSTEIKKMHSAALQRDNAKQDVAEVLKLLSEKETGRKFIQMMAEVADKDDEIAEKGLLLAEKDKEIEALKAELIKTVKRYDSAQELKGKN